MNVPVMLGTSAAFFYSLVSVVSPSQIPIMISGHLFSLISTCAVLIMFIFSDNFGRTRQGQKKCPLADLMSF